MPRKAAPVVAVTEVCRPSTDTHAINEYANSYEYVLPLGDNIGALKDFTIGRGVVKFMFQKKTPGFSNKGITVLEGTTVKWD